MLELESNRLRYTNHKGEILFDADLGEVSIEFPGLNMGHGFNVVLDDENRYAIMFAVGRGDFSQMHAHFRGVKATKPWREVLAKRSRE
jgi:hypothetical protein